MHPVTRQLRTARCNNKTQSSVQNSENPGEKSFAELAGSGPLLESAPVESPRARVSSKTPELCSLCSSRNEKIEMSNLSTARLSALEIWSLKVLSFSFLFFFSHFSSNQILINARLARNKRYARLSRLRFSYACVPCETRPAFLHRHIA